MNLSSSGFGAGPLVKLWESLGVQSTSAGKVVLSLNRTHNRQCRLRHRAAVAALKTPFVAATIDLG